ncbi:putative bifunctional diguanylate cyclase/phosphodiesterase [Izhakiella australiensis]|uniref:putative bifunctional diguanylate cyclase/phosphodiesterase n=1 Tax=Izhakiella australiensis TaxID=1926881 RepID=UPI0030D08B9B
MIKITNSFRSHFIREILLPLVAVLVITFIAASATLSWATVKNNQDALKVQHGIIHASLLQSAEEMRQQQQSLAQWRLLIEHLQAASLDVPWMDENIGGWLSQMFNHQLVYILSAGQQIRYRWERPGMAANGYADEVVENARRWQADAPAIQPLQRVALIRLGGRPAMLAVSSIGASSDPRNADLLISVRFIDADYLQALSERSHLQGLRIIEDGNPLPLPARYTLRNLQGQAVGVLSWQPDKPGSRMLRFIGPVVLVVVIIITIICIVMIRRLWLSSLRLSSTLLQLSASEAQAQHIAFHDVLTGLPNRALVENRLNHSLLAAQKQSVALLLLDLDRFKNVNDTFGHHAGDSLIVEVANRLLPLVNNVDTVGRLGGDEFVIIYHPEKSARSVALLCQNIIDALNRPFMLLGNEAWVGVSIGVAIAPQDAVDRQEMMRKADIALYEAKHQGRGQCCLFAARMDESIKTRQLMASELRQALQQEKLQVYYQPLMNIDGSRVMGLEALLRWHHPGKGFVPPAEFIPIAEETGQIVQLGEWVLREACRVARQWPQLSIAVNVSPIQFRSAGFVERISEIVRSEQADSQQIELEITEGVLMDDTQEAKVIIDGLRAAGFRIALDDFGTGYSSLNYLSHFPVDKIKIDRSFIQSLDSGENATAIIESVVKLGHAMGLTVTAEGVETSSQMSALAEAGCNQLQGYLFSEAIPPDRIASLLSSGDYSG